MKNKVPEEFVTQKTTKSKVKKRSAFEERDGKAQSAQQPNNTKYRIKMFAREVEKLSKKGWTLHRRVLTLDQTYLRYYSKVPRKFDSKADSLADQQPKGRVLLMKI